MASRRVRAVLLGSQGSPWPQAGSPDASMLSARCVSPLPDFLPLKCDACEQIFCTDHIAYAQHDCTSAYKKVSAERRSNPASCTELLSIPGQRSEWFVGPGSDFFSHLGGPSWDMH